MAVAPSPVLPGHEGPCRLRILAESHPVLVPTPVAVEGGIASPAEATIVGPSRHLFSCHRWVELWVGVGVDEEFLQRRVVSDGLIKRGRKNRTCDGVHAVRGARVVRDGERGIALH